MKYSLTRDYRQLIITFRQVISLRYLREIFTLKPLVIPTITLRLERSLKYPVELLKVDSRVSELWSGIRRLNYLAVCLDTHASSL